MTMKRRAKATTLAMLGALCLSFAATAHAKRSAPAPVPPVVWEGMEYRAPLGVEHMGCVQAVEAASGLAVWETRVYQVPINPLLEEDVQWVFVSGLQVQNDVLLVNAEDGRSYRLDLRTGRVEGFPKTSFLWFLAGGVLLTFPVLFWLCRRCRRSGRGPE